MTHRKSSLLVLPLALLTLGNADTVPAAPSDPGTVAATPTASTPAKAPTSTLAPQAVSATLLAAQASAGAQPQDATEAPGADAETEEIIAEALAEQDEEIEIAVEEAIRQATEEVGLFNPNGPGF